MTDQELTEDHVYGGVLEDRLRELEKDHEREN